MAPVVAPLASADEARDANIQITVTPNAQTINPGESGEYTVRVYNSGSNPVTVQLSTAEGIKIAVLTHQRSRKSQAPLTRAPTKRHP